MDKKIIKELEQKLKTEKDELEKELSQFAKKDEKTPGDWDTRFPSFDKSETGHTRMETAADEVEEYNTLLPIEYALEKKLKKIDLALEKIKKEIYGSCGNCKKEISLERLRVSPEATTCLDCGK
ncbi:TraR/DksA family transcriptional regulator [Patescibacteria group bacterium]